MDDLFNFRGRADAHIRNGVLYIPHSIRDFYRLPREYLLLEDIVDQLNFLSIYSDKELRTIILPRGELSDEQYRFLALRKVKWGGMMGLRLPPSSLEHLAVEKNSYVKIIGGVSHNLEVWKPEDFEKYESLTDLAGVEAKISRRGV